MPFLAHAKSLPQEEAPSLGVKFYRIEAEADGRVLPAYLGQAKWDQGSLETTVHDSSLQKLLLKPYHSQSKKRDMAPGTREHLSALAAESWRFGIVSDVSHLDRE